MIQWYAFSYFLLKKEDKVPYIVADFFQCPNSTRVFSVIWCHLISQLVTWLRKNVSQKGFLTSFLGKKKKKDTNPSKKPAQNQSHPTTTIKFWSCHNAFMCIYFRMSYDFVHLFHCFGGFFICLPFFMCLFTHSILSCSSSVMDHLLIAYRPQERSYANINVAKKYFYMINIFFSLNSWKHIIGLQKEY